MFLNEIKKKINRSIIGYILMKAVVVVIASFAISGIGFSSDFDWSIGPRYSEVGIPVPNWLLSGVFSIVCILLVISIVKDIIDIVKNETYNNAIESLKKYGNLQYLENILGNTPKNELTKSGDLRINPQFFFYFKDATITFHNTNEIVNVRPIMLEDKSKEKDYYVEVSFRDETVKIPVKKKDGINLANNIIAIIRAGQQF